MTLANSPKGLPPAGRFALAAALCSSLGQTFFIGLFGADFRAAFDLSQSALGALYGSATLASGLLMFWLGSMADHWSMRRAISIVLVGLGLGALVIASANTVAVLVAGLFLLRLCGQGLAGHLAVVAAARYARQRRGRAVAMVSYGFILGEALFPALVAVGVDGLGWRGVWLVASVATFAVAVPGLVYLAWPLTHPREIAHAADRIETAPIMTRQKLFTHGSFLRVLTIVLVPPIVVTAVFLHQGTLAEMLEWNRADIASGFLLFAVIQGVFAFAGGRVIDRFSARSLLRYSLLPAGLGLLSLSLLTPAASLWVLFAGIGMTAGLNGVITGAVWVELFGSAQLGMIRGVYSALMVVSTALGPVGLGLLFDWNVSLIAIAVAYLVYAAVIPALVLPAVHAISAEG